MNITKDKGKIFQHGGGEIRVCKIAEAETYTGSDYFLSLGYIQDFELKDETTTEDIFDETGNLVKTINGNRLITLNATLMQVSKSTLDFFSDYSSEIGNKYFSVYRLSTRPVAPEGDSFVEQWFGICQIKPMINIKYPTPRLPIEIKVLENKTAIVITFADRFDTDYTPKASTSTTIPVGKYYNTTETAVV